MGSEPVIRSAVIITVHVAGRIRPGDAEIVIRTFRQSADGHGVRRGKPGIRHRFPHGRVLAVKHGAVRRLVRCPCDGDIKSGDVLDGGVADGGFQAVNFSGVGF